MRGRIRERIEGREGEAVVEATGGEVDALKAEGEEASANTNCREGTFTGGTGPGGIGLIKMRGGNGLSGIRGTVLGEEERKRVLIFLKDGSGLLDAGGFNGRFGKPELEAGDGPIENGREGVLELVSKL